MKVGDKVVVIDPGLAMLRSLMSGQPPNNIGWVREIHGDEILVAFPIDDEDEGHYQVAPYPKNMMKAWEANDG